MRASVRASVKGAQSMMRICYNTSGFEKCGVCAGVVFLHDAVLDGVGVLFAPVPLDLCICG